MWNLMSDDAMAAATDHLLEDLVKSREEAATKTKTLPIHILNDVSSTMTKIVREVCCMLLHALHRMLRFGYPQLDALSARTGFETVITGTRTSADHYTAPIVHNTSKKITTFFELVIKNPLADLATALEAFCLSGVDGSTFHHLTTPASIDRLPISGVVGNLVKREAQMRSEVASLITEKLSMFLSEFG